MSQEEVEVFSKETFLTSVKRISESTTGHGSSSVIDTTPAMLVVREKHAQLRDVVGSLSEKISAVLARQERDFLAAYRAHMYNVQKELHEMREKIHHNETVANKSEKIKKLEDERDWYRKEALRLDAFTTTLTKDLKHMKENLEAIEEDRKWLEKQLKGCKKQNKLLRAELDVRLAGIGNHSGMDSSGTFPLFDLQGRPGVKAQRNRASQDLNATGFSAGAHGLPQLNMDGNSTSQSPLLVDEREGKLIKQIRSLKKDLQRKSNELTSIKRQQHLLQRDESTGQSLLEKFFLQCVDSVKEEVGRRRDYGPTSAIDRKAAQRRTCSTISIDKTRQSKFEVELDDFTPSDRTRLIERLLAHDEVLSFLYVHLFPSGKPSVVNTEVPETNRSSEPLEAAIHKSESLPSTPHALTSLPNTSIAFTSFESIGNNSNRDVDSMSEQNKPSGDGNGATTPVGSGAAAVSAVRNRSLPLDLFTKEYLKSV